MIWIGAMNFAKFSRNFVDTYIFTNNPFFVAVQSKVHDDGLSMQCDVLLAALRGWRSVECRMFLAMPSSHFHFISLSLLYCFEKNQNVSISSSIFTELEQMKSILQKFKYNNINSSNSFRLESFFFYIEPIFAECFY